MTELNGGAQRACSYRPSCDGVVAQWPRPHMKRFALVTPWQIGCAVRNVDRFEGHLLT
jgi:hypothetical protein